MIFVHKLRSILNLKYKYLSVAGGDEGLLHALRDLDLFTRASEDPFCSLSVDCSDDSNRNYLDGVEYRTTDGMCNNVDNFSWGMAGIQHLRLLDDAYDNGEASSFLVFHFCAEF